MRALIPGGGGQLGSDLQALVGDDARAFSHGELDITDTAALDRAFAEVEPEVVFNCAAFHNVDVCEVEREQAWRVNVEAVRELARKAREQLGWSHITGFKDMIVEMVRSDLKVVLEERNRRDRDG